MTSTAQHQIVENDDTEVHNLVRKGKTQELAKIAQQGGLERVNKDGQTALFVAVQNRRDRKGLCKFLLDLGANVNHADKDGRTPLSLAVANGDKEVCQLLLPHVDKVKLHPQHCFLVLTGGVQFLWRDDTFTEVGYVGVDEIGRWKCVEEKEDAASFFLMSGLHAPVHHKKGGSVSFDPVCMF